jgi:hypothetical protein
MAQDTAAARLQDCNHCIISVNDFLQELIAPAAHDTVLKSKPTSARTCDESDKTLENT